MPTWDLSKRSLFPSHVTHRKPEAAQRNQSSQDHVARSKRSAVVGQDLRGRGWRGAANAGAGCEHRLELRAQSL